MKHTLLTLLILALFISYASAASLTFSLTSSIPTKETATTINWTQTGYSSTDTLTLNLISPSKTTPFTIATNLAVTNLSYSWQIPSIIDEGDNYTIQAIIGASTYSSSLIIITSASSVTGKIEFNLLKNNRIDYQFQLQPG